MSITSRFSYENLDFNSILDDLCVRFIINCPPEEFASVERICFQIEEAQWYYEDFVREQNHLIPPMSLRNFTSKIFEHCYLLRKWSGTQEKVFDDFMAYKTRIPVRGAIILNDKMSKVLLVKGWKSNSSWGFPKGKINKDEEDHVCAAREVDEEIGFDITPYIDPNEYIELTMREKQVRLYITRGVPLNSKFEPRTRKEISRIEWYNLKSLPTYNGYYKSNNESTGNPLQDSKKDSNNFYLVIPFLQTLKKWISKQRSNDRENFAKQSFPNDFIQDMLIPQQEVPQNFINSPLENNSSSNSDKSKELMKLLNPLSALSSSNTIDSINNTNNTKPLPPQASILNQIFPNNSYSPSTSNTEDNRGKELLSLLKSNDSNTSGVVPSDNFFNSVPISRTNQINPIYNQPTPIYNQPSFVYNQPDSNYNQLNSIPNQSSSTHNQPSPIIHNQPILINQPINQTINHINQQSAFSDSAVPSESSFGYLSVPLNQQNNTNTYSPSVSTASPAPQVTTPVLPFSSPGLARVSTSKFPNDFSNSNNQNKPQYPLTNNKFPYPTPQDELSKMVKNAAIAKHTFKKTTDSGNLLSILTRQQEGPSSGEIPLPPSKMQTNTSTIFQRESNRSSSKDLTNTEILLSLLRGNDGKQNNSTGQNSTVGQEKELNNMKNATKIFDTVVGDNRNNKNKNNNYINSSILNGNQIYNNNNVMPYYVNFNQNKKPADTNGIILNNKPNYPDNGINNSNSYTTSNINTGNDQKDLNKPKSSIGEKDEADLLKYLKEFAL